MKVTCNSLFKHMDVLCAHTYSKYTLIGVGDSLYVYSQDKLHSKIRIFTGEKVHCISSCGNKILVTGVKKVSVLHFCKSEQLEYCLEHSLELSDWIQDVKLTDETSCSLALVTAHNVFKFVACQTTDKKVITSDFTCKEKCILYSSAIVGQDLANMVVLGGTVFSDVIIWIPYHEYNDKDRPLLHRLKGHKGVIFSITVDISSRKICTTSDDRSMCIWSISIPNYEGPIMNKTHWQNSNITLHYVLFGHIARVWKSLFLPTCYVSAGEDSKLCFWSEKGQLEKCLSLFQDSGIRALSYSGQENSIITGGEDGGVISLNLKKLTSKVIPHVLVMPDSCKNHQPARVLLLKSRIVVTSDKGGLFATDEHKNLQLIYENEDYVNYCLIEVSPCKRFVALASLRGRLLIYDFSSHLVLVNKILVNGRIFSVHWLGDFILTCASKGIMELWKFSLEPELNKEKEFILPDSKEQWTTCALIYEDVLLVGDRMGSIFTYALNKDSPTANQTFLKIHGHLGVTDILSSGNRIFTTGRDGSVKEFKLTKGHLNYTVGHKLPMEWAWKIVPYGSDKLILGFNSVFLIIWSLQNRDMLFKFNCGGGHRSSDYRLTNEQLNFVYVKDKKVSIIEFTLNRYSRLRNSYHGKEINCLKILKRNPIVFVSGSEDTTLRICRILNDDIETLYVLEKHISSVRTISTCDRGENIRMIVSAGGRAQIVVHDFDTAAFECQEIAVEKLNIEDKKKWKRFGPTPETETRFMCLDCLKIDSQRVLIAMGCSDRQIRFFMRDEKLTSFGSIPYSHCILKVSFLLMEEHYLLLTMGTDGRVVFWDLTCSISEMSSISVDTPLTYMEIHQSGINSFDLKEINGGLFAIATGGDDNMLAVVTFRISTTDGLKIESLSEWYDSGAHSCQITGVQFVQDYLLSASIDQRITVWRWSLKENEIVVKFVDQFISVVADVQGMDVHPSEQDKLMVFVYGKGVEMFEVDLPGYSLERGTCA